MQDKTVINIFIQPNLRAGGGTTAFFMFQVTSDSK